MNLKDKCVKKDMVKDCIKEIYDSDENPLDYMIEPKGSVDIVEKDYETTKEDLEHILDS